MDEWTCKHPELRMFREVRLQEAVFTCAVCGRSIRVSDRMLWNSVKHVKSGIGEAFGKQWAERFMPSPPTPTEEPPTEV
jgi:hypothetical protein